MVATYIYDLNHPLYLIFIKINNRVSYSKRIKLNLHQFENDSKLISVVKIKENAITIINLIN